MCSVWFLEWLGQLLPLEESYCSHPAGSPMGTFLLHSMILEGPFHLRIFCDFMILSCCACCKRVKKRKHKDNRISAGRERGEGSQIQLKGSRA